MYRVCHYMPHCYARMICDADMRSRLVRGRSVRRPSMSSPLAPPPPKDTILRLSKVHQNLKTAHLSSDPGDVHGDDGSADRKLAAKPAMARFVHFASQCLLGCLMVLGRDVSIPNLQWKVMSTITFLQVSPALPSNADLKFKRVDGFLASSVPLVCSCCPSRCRPRRSFCGAKVVCQRCPSSWPRWA